MRTPTGIAMPTELGARLRYLRELAELSPEKVSLKIGISARVIGDWERGYRTPRLFYLRKLAHLYGVSITALVNVKTIPEEIATNVV